MAYEVGSIHCGRNKLFAVSYEHHWVDQEVISVQMERS